MNTFLFYLQVVTCGAFFILAVVRMFDGGDSWMMPMLLSAVFSLMADNTKRDGL